MTDEEILKNVLDELKWDSRLSPTEIGVTVKDGVVSLVGTVDSYMKKWQAEEVALRVRGVRAVANELEVKLGESDERDDEALARAAKLALEDASDIPSSVTVTVDNGWITLRGDVEWQFQRQSAERKIRNLRGVKGVINTIEVKPKMKPEDLKRKIENALIRAAETDAKRIQVEVQDGRVVLKGKVHSWYEKEEAKREAWLAPGVRDVVDELRIAFD
ncbi:MAG: transport-associated protein [Myxococcales bacterium]|nr:transport-associated protein [Myxococcales bacterium]